MCNPSLFLVKVFFSLPLNKLHKKMSELLQVLTQFIPGWNLE